PAGGAARAPPGRAADGGAPPPPRPDAPGSAPAVAERHAGFAVTAGATSGRRAAALCPDAAARRYPVGVATGWRRRRHDWRSWWDRRRADSAQLDRSKLQRLPPWGAPTDQTELGIPLRQERRNTRVRIQDRVLSGRVRYPQGGGRAVRGSAAVLGLCDLVRLPGPPRQTALTPL